MKDLYLCLDISSTCTGYSFLDEDGNCHLVGCIRTGNRKKFSTNYDIIDEICRVLFEEVSNIDGNVVGIFSESALKKFSRGRSSASTIAKLTSINFATRYELYRKFGLTAVEIAPTAVKKLVGYKKKEDKKEKTLEFVIDRFPDFPIEYTRYGNTHQKCYDMADSIAIGWIGLETEKKEESK